ncbi:MAG: patatin-like phospholipase family protein [Deltaproteobacteria bacterium]|nr:patatin-like phospholipase family protein [Deltaproteobacteria bacterium]
MGKSNTLVRKKKNLPSREPFSRQYSRLIRSISQKDTKVVVSMGGGGVRMFAHISVIRFLEKLGAEPYISEVWGASGGAIVGLFLSMGLRADEIMREADAYFKEHQLKLYPSIFSVVKNVVRDAIFSEADPAMLKGFHSINEQLQHLVSQTLKTGKEKYPFYSLAYNLANNQTDVLTPSLIPEGIYSDFIFRTDPLDAIIASSAIPVLFHPKVIDDANGKRTYTDGATGEEIPTVSIYKKWLRDREVGLEKRKKLLVIAVSLGSDLSSGGFFEQWLIRKIPAFEYFRMTVRLTDMIRQARISEQKRTLMQDPNVELWEVNLDLAKSGFLDVKGIPRVMELAEKSAPIEFTRINNLLLG